MYRLSRNSYLLIFIVSILYCSCSDVFEYKFKNIFACDLDMDSEYILVVGDIQEYTMDEKLANNYFVPTHNWIRGMNMMGYQIDCVLQTGDVSNNNEDWQYAYFYETTKNLAEEVLYITTTGNHDYEWDKESQITDRKSSKLSNYCSFPRTCDNVEEYFEKGIMDNIIVRNTIRGERCDIIVLEFGPRPEVVDWANKYVESHPERKFIVLTHEFLVGPAPGHRVTNKWSDSERHFKTIPATTPQYIWENLVYPNDNIRCVLCGHNSFSLQVYEKNKAGRNVPQILFNLQYVKNGGDGLIQVWRIPKDGSDIEVKVYNTVSNQLYRDSIDEQINWHNAEFHFSL